MKTIIAFCALVVVVVAFPGDTYDPRYDNFNAQELADNLRLLKSYGKCFLDQGPCTPEGADFKKSIPEALRTTCAKCTPKQRELIRIVVRAFQTKLPDVWEQITKKEDPNGEYKESFEAFLNRSD
uniref:Chemosensory protein 6 n=1 Tax=Streltzoviella insularis TaxID=1206366 RepID=A0A7D5UMM3_9NEOP|nr:chemosensory protein 6 [Streltzoviella insularis]